MQSGDDLNLGDFQSPSAAVADHLRSGGSVGGIADGERTGNRIRALRLDVVSSLLHGRRDGGASGSLRAEEAHGLVLDQTKVDEFLEGLADLANQRTAGHRNDDIVGETPSELLGDLVCRLLLEKKKRKCRIGFLKEPRGMSFADLCVFLFAIFAQTFVQSV